MKMNIEWVTRQTAVALGFNYAGFTTDQTAIQEIQRDYLAQGYTRLVWVEEKEGYHYYTSHPNINPVLHTDNLPHNKKV